VDSVVLYELVRRLGPKLAARHLLALVPNSAAVNSACATATTYGRDVELGVVHVHAVDYVLRTRD
jgi:hypothetical protein